MPPITTLSNTAARQARKILPQVFRPRGDNPVQFATSQLGLTVPFALATLYQIAKAKRSGDSQYQSRSIGSMVEAGIANALIQHTKGVYPLLGLAKAFYDMGDVEGKREKIYAGLKAGVLFTAGFLGIHLGAWINDGLRYRDAKTLNRLIQPLEHLLAPANPDMASLEPLNPSLKAALIDLKTKSSALAKLFEREALANSTVPVVDQIKVKTLAFEKAQEKTLAAISRLSKSHQQQLGEMSVEHLLELGKKINAIQSYNSARVFNPIFGYLMAIGFIGIPLVNLLTKMSNMGKSPAFKQASADDIGPLWLDTAINLFSAPPAKVGNNHYTPVVSANGPALIASVASH